jgi:hypothetical protein
MNSMQIDHNRLAKLIAGEVALYRELFFLTDKQRDWIDNGSEIEIDDILKQIEGVQSRIVESEQRLKAARDADPASFDRLVRAPRIAALVRDIKDLVEKTQKVVEHCSRAAQCKRAEYRAELSRMEVGRLLFATMASGSDQPMFVDHRP